MREFLSLVKCLAAVTAAWFAELNPLIQLLLGLMVLDIITGFLAGGKAKSLSSDVSFVGMRKKATIICLVASAGWLSAFLSVDLGLGAAVAGFYAANELLSITENAAKLGLPVPSLLAEAISQFKREPRRKPE